MTDPYGFPNQWEFVYNGLSQRVAEKFNGNVTRRWILDGAEIAEQRAADGTTVQRRFYREGEQRLGGSDAGTYFYTRDHLGSIREVTDSTATLRARYDYDPYGQREKLAGSLDSDFGFTGHFTHQASGLVLTHYRAYDSETGRWLSRDPIGESGGINLYGYCFNSPANWIDPLGLEVRACYSIGEKWLTAVDIDTGASVTTPMSSGTNDPNDIDKKLSGPIPPGVYAIYERKDGLHGHPAYILDPIDSRTGNDKWDGGTGRSAFRIHIEVPSEPRSGSEGCIVAGAQMLGNLDDLLQNTSKGPIGTIVSPNSSGPPHRFRGPRLGTLTVTK